MLIFVDSFGHYDQAQMDEKWDVVGVPYGENPSDPADAVSIVQGRTIGRFGGGGVTFDCPTLPNLDSVAQQDDLQYLQKNYDGVSVVHVGLAFIQNSTQLTAGSRLLTFLDGATTQVGIDILPSGQLRAVRATVAGTGIFLSSIGSSGSPPTYTVEDTTVAAISSSAYDFLEFKVTHHPTAGIIEIKRNGATFETLTGLNTAISGSNNSSSVLVGGYGAVFTSNDGTLQSHYLRGTVSDFHLLNTTVDAADALNPVTFIGDRHWENITPTADGNYAQWTPSTGTDHFALVDEVPPNTSDYNSSSTVGNKDSFDVSAPTGPVTATALISLTMYCQKNTGGSNEIKGLMRLTGADRNGTAFQVPNPYGFRQSFLASKPGGGAITLQNIIDGELGYEKTV